MKEIIKKVRHCHKILTRARIKGNNVDTGFLVKDTIFTIYVEITAFINSVVLIKYVLDHVQRGIEFSKCIFVFGVIILLNLLSMIAETYRDNVMRTKHIHLLAKDISKDFYLKLEKLNYQEQFNSKTKDISMFAYYNAAMAFYNSETIVSTYIGYAVAFIINFVTVVLYGGLMGLIILLLFLAITIWIQKIVVKVNNIEFIYMLKKNSLNRRFRYYKDSIFLNKHSNQVLKVEYAFDFFLSKYKDIIEEQKQEDIRKNKESFWYKVLKSHLFSLLYHVIYFVCFSYKLIVLKTLSIGKFWACYRACLDVFGNNVINYFGVMQQATQYIEQIYMFFDIQDEDDKVKKIGIDANSNFEIVFENVAFSYPGKGRKVLKDINLKISKGESIVLLGENGAGKSTVLLLLYRLLKPTEGKILLNGIDIAAYDLKQYRNLLNIMFQDFKLYPYSLASNIILQNMYENERDLIMEKVKEAGLESVINKLEFGIDTRLTRLFDIDGYVPSGGETSKIGFAQQSMNENGVFIFDEYDSDIDPISEQELNERLLAMGKTKIIISHRISIAKEADRIYWIENGKTIEEGTHQELLDLHGKYAYLFEQRKKLFCEDR